MFDRLRNQLLEWFPKDPDGAAALLDDLRQVKIANAWTPNGDHGIGTAGVRTVFNGGAVGAVLARISVLADWDAGEPSNPRVEWSVFTGKDAGTMSTGWPSGTIPLPHYGYVCGVSGCDIEPYLQMARDAVDEPLRGREWLLRSR